MRTVMRRVMRIVMNVLVHVRFLFVQLVVRVGATNMVKFYLFFTLYILVTKYNIFSLSAIDVSPKKPSVRNRIAGNV